MALAWVPKRNTSGTGSVWGVIRVVRWLRVWYARQSQKYNYNVCREIIEMRWFPKARKIDDLTDEEIVGRVRQSLATARTLQKWQFAVHVLKALTYLGIAVSIVYIVQNLGGGGGLGPGFGLGMIAGYFTGLSLHYFGTAFIRVGYVLDDQFELRTHRLLVKYHDGLMHLAKTGPAQ